MMTVTAHLHNLTSVKAFNREGTGWVEFKSKDGNTFAIFMPFDVALALSAAFNGQSARPYLIEALKRTLNYIENTEGEMGETLPCGETARDAIAKATGAA